MEDIDECSNLTLNNCDKNAQCIDLFNGYKCKCNDGFIGNGTSCILIDGIYIYSVYLLRL